MGGANVFLRETEELPDLGIVLSDGCRLSGRVWRPVDAADDPVPAILGYLPYRKRDGTAARDALTHPWLARRGHERWSRKFGPFVKLNCPMKRTIRNDEENPVFGGVQGACGA